MQYRIKHVDMIGYFAQVKHYSWFGQWRTIGKHSNNQVGEYDDDHLAHPLQSQGDAVRLAHRHAAFNKEKKGFTTYSDIML